MKKIFTILFYLFIFNLGQAQIIDTLINVGSYKLHFNILKGEGTPILFESGNGSDASDWKDILKQLHDSTKTTLITYDRAGLGLSGIDTNKIDLQNEVKTLEIALKKLGYSKKIFLVSHSFGSFYSILFAIRNRQKIKGSVFIEPALPCNYTKKRNKEGNETVTPELWDRIKKEAVGLYYILKNYEEIYDLMEKKNFPSKIPATVIGAENQAFLKTEYYKTEWRRCIEDFGRLPNHTYVFAKKSGHTVWLENPQLVINEIIKMYRQTKY
jgi:pimeloyl-ACP methyl ester carboxylesterase